MTAPGENPSPETEQGPPPPRGSGPEDQPRRGAIPMVVWGVMLGILTVVQLQYLRLLPVLLLGGAAAGIALLGAATALVLTLRRRRAPPGAPGQRALPDLSPAAVVAAVGVCALAAGAEVGAWLAIGGGGLLALAVFLLARELRDARRLERAGAPPFPASQERGR